MTKYLKTKDSAILNGTYQFFVADNLLREPATPLESVQSAIDFVAQADPKARSLRPEDVIDNSLLRPNP